MSTFTLTLQTDKITTKTKNAVFNAPLVAQVATLQTGDSIIDTGTGGTLNAIFNPVVINLLGAEIDGVATWNLTNVCTWNAPQWITGGSLVTGLRTLNALNSNAPIVVGVTGAPLQSALQTVSLTNTNSTLTILIAASALSGTNDTLNVILNNVHGSLIVGPDSNAADGYEIWSITTTGNNQVALSQGSATSAKTIKISGSGNLALSGLQDFPNLATIDAFAFTGNLTAM